jgi:Fe(3+) dicitrate transport protein
MKILIRLAMVAQGLLIAHGAAAQNIDTAATNTLKTVTIRELLPTVERLPAEKGVYLYQGKKNEVIHIASADASVAEKTGRQIFAKVPGVFVYDMDGSGNQLNISTRGLDPHRGWEFNTRLDGALTNSDMYGYPASHYSLPMEAIERIELVRGSGSLQYGAQFGGMVNYLTKQGDTTRALSYEGIHTAGAFGLLSTYHALGGKSGKWQYYAYYSRRHADGYRDNSESDYDGQAFRVRYEASSKWALNASLARSNYLYHIPGPLNDSMFQANPRQATRSRNYFNPEIWIPALSAEWRPTTRTTIQWQTTAVLGERRSVLFDKPSTTPDAVQPATLQPVNRQVDIDAFNSYTTELRLLQQYSMFSRSATLVAGVQYMHNNLHRRSVGKGTTGSDYDLQIDGDWARNLHFLTQNWAGFVENKFPITAKWTINPGFRFENGASDMSGKILYLTDAEVPLQVSHRFVLPGVNTEYQLNGRQNLYAGFAQAYRPVIFKDLIPGSVYERIDPNIKDADGYNAELGFRGNSRHWRWDLGLFRLQYNNRAGNLVVESDSVFYTYKTNIGNSLTQGVEAFVEYHFLVGQNLRCNVFTSTAYFDAHYQDAAVKVGQENISVKGNRLEAVPEWISRNGLNIRFKGLSVTALYSYTADSYADALNTVLPSSTGSVGLVPAYHLVDLNASYRIEAFTIKLNINNVGDVSYFTKRPTFYPGPGIWPSDGRNFNVSVIVKY